MRNVVEGIQNPFEDEAHEEEEVADEKLEAESEDGFEENFNEEHVFPIEVELKSVDGKRLVLDCEVNAGAQEASIMVTNAALVDPEIKADASKNEYAYSGPQYDQLDEELRGAIDGYANRLISADLIQFISDYAFSKESTQYGVWLENFKQVISKKNN